MGGIGSECVGVHTVTSGASEHLSDDVVILVQQVFTKRPPNQSLEPAVQWHFSQEVSVGLQSFSCFHFILSARACAIDLLHMHSTT